MYKIIPFENLYDYDYSVKIINAVRSSWKNHKSFSCIGSPKEKNIMLFLDGCKARYKFKDGSTYVAESGMIVYTPINSEYDVEFYDFENSHSHTISFNFFLYDASYNPFLLHRKILIFEGKDLKYRLLFNQLADLSDAARPSPAKMKAVFYDLFVNLSNDFRLESLASDKFHIISKGIIYLEESKNHELDIDAIAAMCNISGVYFRKLFKEYAGVSPGKYRLNVCISKAKQYLKYEELSISEISERLGFCDPAYFSRQFKIQTKMSPLEYRHAKRG